MVSLLTLIILERGCFAYFTATPPPNILNGEYTNKTIEAVGELGVKELKEVINFDRVRFKKMGADLIFEGEPVNQTWKV
jgi:hypothetical protein